MKIVRLTQVFTAGAAIALGMAALAVSAPARAAEDDVSIDQQVFRSIMDGLGLKRDGEGITYQERAPLVIPPGRDLPPPERSDAVTANNPAWPKDPDVTRRKLEAAMEKDRNISDEREREQNPLRPDQLTPGARGTKKRQQARADDGYQPPASGFDNQLSPSQLGYKGNMFGSFFGAKKGETAKFTGEPPRTSLTEPPRGYQTPSPDQPYGLVGTEKPKAYDAYRDRADPSLTR